MKKQLDTSVKNIEEIFEFWTNNAKSWGSNHSASWTDSHCMNIEVKEILNYIIDGQNILDIGCANGFSTFKYASERKVTIQGVDYVEEMISAAKQKLSEIKDSLSGDIEFKTGNILKIDEPDARYDVVICVRVLCNLFNHENQKVGLTECLRVLKQGGILIFSEPTINGWKKLNKFRKEWQLDEINIPEQNFYLDEESILSFLKDKTERISIKNFASTYFVMTRIIKPLLSYARGIENNIIDPNLEWNKFSSLLPSVGDYGIQKMFILRKI